MRVQNDTLVQVYTAARDEGRDVPTYDRLIVFVAVDYVEECAAGLERYFGHRKCSVSRGLDDRGGAARQGENQYREGRNSTMLRLNNNYVKLLYV